VNSNSILVFLLIYLPKDIPPQSGNKSLRNATKREMAVRRSIATTMLCCKKIKKIENSLKNEPIIFHFQIESKIQ